MAKMISPHFSFDEMICRCGNCGRADMDPDFMKLLEEIRKAYGRPMRVSSAFRCDDHNGKVSTVKNGPHTHAKNGSRAADILVSGARAMELFALAKEVGANGLGVSQTGSHADRFIHIDGVDRPAQAMWSY